MGRISNCFKNLGSENRKALIVYVVAGDPGKQVTVPLMHAMVAAGADMIELGVPFTDPEADGPVIQAGAERALAHHTSLHDVLEMVREFREKDDKTPVLLMGYLNPIEVMGYEQFAVRCAASGVDGTLTVNLPPEEATEIDPVLIENGIDPVYMLSPTTSAKRAAMICKRSRGFVYYASLKGVTGAATLDMEDVRRKLELFRGLADLPIGVGFGIKDEQSAVQVARVADGVAAGTVLVRIVEQYQNEVEKIPGQVANWVAKVRQALDRAS